MPPQQAPIVVGDSLSNALANRNTEIKPATPAAPRPEKEDVNAAGRNGFNAGFAQGMQAVQGMGGGQQLGVSGARGAYSTGQKLTAGSRPSFAKGKGSLSSNGRRSGKKRQPGANTFAGAGSGMNNGRRSQGSSQIGRGSPAMN